MNDLLILILKKMSAAFNVNFYYLCFIEKVEMLFRQNVKEKTHI